MVDTISTKFEGAFYNLDDVSVYECDTVYTAEAGNNDTICKGDSVQIGAMPYTKYSYHWQPATGLSNDTIANPYAKPAVTTTYYLTQKDFMSVVTVDSVTITVYPLPTVIVSASPDTICNDSSSTLIASGALSYNWSNGMTGNPITVTPTITTTYTITGTGNGSCISTATVTVTVNPVPTVTASASPDTICSDSSATLKAGGALSYNWSNGMTGKQITVTPTTTTSYTVTGTVTGGCANTATVKVNVKSCEDTTKNSLTIPNVFTPNGDGHNDYFKITGQNIRSINEKIFNRWGQLLYKWNDINEHWDGKYNNK